MKTTKQCIFCNIASHKLPAVVIWEDEHYLAILDINPNVVGMTLVIPKKHYPSYAFDMLETEYTNLMTATRKVGKLLDKKLGVRRTALVMEGLGVDPCAY